MNEILWMLAIGGIVALVIFLIEYISAKIKREKNLSTLIDIENFYVSKEHKEGVLKSGILYDAYNDYIAILCSKNNNSTKYFTEIIKLSTEDIINSELNDIKEYVGRFSIKELIGGIAGLAIWILIIIFFQFGNWSLYVLGIFAVGTLINTFIRLKEETTLKLIDKWERIYKISFEDSDEAESWDALFKRIKHEIEIERNLPANQKKIKNAFKKIRRYPYFKLSFEKLKELGLEAKDRNDMMIFKLAIESVNSRIDSNQERLIHFDTALESMEKYMLKKYGQQS